MNRMMRTVLGIFFAAVIAVSAIWIIQNLGRQLRLDITERKLYTLSDGTRQILDGLTQPITIKLFYSKTASNNHMKMIRPDIHGRKGPIAPTTCVLN